jgi:hypothetical protein
MFQSVVHTQTDIHTDVNDHSGFLVCVSSNQGKPLAFYFTLNNVFAIFVVDFIGNLPRVFKDVDVENTSFQHTLNGLMSTESTDEYVTRIWSTCPSMLTIHGTKGKDEDNLTYIIDDSNSPLPVTSVLECVQNSSKQMLEVSIAERKGVNASFGDLYAHFLIEGHTHTTHYVSMSKEFPGDKDQGY